MPKLPKYVEIINYFEKMIEKGTIAEGEPLVFEDEICRQFSASHMTVTKAMNELSARGYIKRIPGKGTFASGGYKTRIHKSMFKSNSVTSLIRDSGLIPRTEVLRYAVIKGKDNPEVSKILKIADEEFMHFFVCTRYGNDDLVCISYTYVSQMIMKTIDITQIPNSFNEYVSRMGIRRSYGYTEFCATLPTEEQAKIIGTSHLPLLKQTIMWNVNDSPFELTFHYYVGDKYTITQDLMLKYNDDGTYTKEIRND